MGDRIGHGRYELGPKLGYGGMATVYSAHDLKLDRKVAIKLLADNYAGDDEIRERFMREARLAAKLDHPNVVQVYDVGEEDDRPYIVMEQVEGGTLGDRLNGGRGGLPRQDALRLLCQMCDGLGHAHSRRLVHRDIKPGNLLLRESDDCLKIADFGIARVAEDTRLTRPGKVIGTERYMAPEQLRDGEITPATDVYACGVVADEVLPRKRPAAMQEIVERCVQEDPGDRFPDARALGEAFAALDGEGAAVPLRRVRTQGPTTVPTAPVEAAGAPVDATAPFEPPETATRRLEQGRRLRRTGGRRGGRLAAGLAIVALVAAGIVAALGSDGSDTPVDAKSAAQRDRAAAAATAPVSVPRSDDPAEQARRLSEFLRSQAR